MITAPATGERDFIAAPDDPAIDIEMAAAVRKHAELIRLDGGPAEGMIENRAQHERLAPYWNEGAPALAEVSNLTVDRRGGGIPARLYRPVRERVPVLIYLHGGGWCRGSIETADCTCRHLADESGFAVLSLGYRLAPEHPYPAALEDTLAALDWLRTEGESHSLDTTRMFMGGGSAGANLSLVAALRCRDEGRIPPVGLLLFYGAYQCFDFGNASHSAFGDGRYGLSTERMMNYLTHYVPSGMHVTDPGISPLKAASVAGLPPAWFGIAELDVLRDEQLAMSARILEEGGEAEIHLYRGLTHGFGARTRMVSRAVAALGDAARFMQRVAGR